MYKRINWKLLIWGLGSLHFQLGLAFVFFWLMPPGYGFGYNLLMMLGLMIVFGLNIMISYLLGSRVGPAIDEIPVILIWVALSLAALVLGKIALSHHTLAHARVETLDLAVVTKHKADFVYLKNARILTEYTLNSYSVHSRHVKGQTKSSYRVNQKMAPLVTNTWKSGQRIRHFVCYNSKSVVDLDFDVKYAARPFYLTEFSAKYPTIAQELVQKYALHRAAQPTYWELMDLPKARQRAKKNFLWFYGIVMGTAVAVFGFFAWADGTD